MSHTITSTATYTVVDIRKTFEGFEADLRMIAARTGKMTNLQVENYFHDIMAWAENKYLEYIDITLVDVNNRPIKASRYSINENGQAIQSQRAGNNDWPSMVNTELNIILAYNSSWRALSDEQKRNFQLRNNFKSNWISNDIDNSYNHLSRENAQLYASKGYELKKENFK